MADEKYSPKVSLEGLPEYRDAQGDFGKQLQELIDENAMDQQVAKKLLTDFQYTSFNQIVTVRYE